MSRPSGSKNTIPGPTEVRERIESLRRRADQGDAMATTALVLIGLTARNLPSENAARNK